MRSRKTLAICALAAVGCSSETGGAVVTVWGEAYIEQGLPSTEDGWSLRYDTFLVVVGEFQVGDGPEGAEASRLSAAATTLFDLQAKGPHEVGRLTSLAAGPWTDVGYAIVPISEATAVHASASDRDLMLAGGFSIYVEGEAVKEQETKSFAWGFTTNTRYSRCVDVGGAQEISGTMIEEGSTAAIELTIHGDHLFYDDLQSPEARLRFQHMADADVDTDGVVTLEELAAVSLASIPAEEGSYGVGASDVDDLGAYVTASTRTLGHFNGEGHCAIERRDL